MSTIQIQKGSPQSELSERLTVAGNVGGLARASMLLDSGADPAHVGQSGFSFITSAIRHDRWDALELLSARKYDFGGPDAARKLIATCQEEGAPNSKRFFERIAVAPQDPDATAQISTPGSRAQLALDMLDHVSTLKIKLRRP